MNIFESIKKGLQEAIKCENDKLDLEEKLLEAEVQRLNGTNVFSLDEGNEQLDAIVNNDICF